MNPNFNNILSGLNSQAGVRTHGSVEDLIRATLGSNFMDNMSKAEELAPEPPIEINPNPEPPKPPKKKEPKEPQCEECGLPVSICACTLEDSEDESQEGYDEIDYGAEFDDEEDDLDELPPFQRVLRSGEFKTKESEKKFFKNTEGIGKTPPKEKVPVKPITKHYVFYRDMDEVFECKVTIEGTMSTATARLVLNTDNWNLVFYGKIKRDGTCLIPLKKLTIFPSGTSGRATLEVVVDDVMFSPWENAFKVEESRKVKVQIKGKS